MKARRFDEIKYEQRKNTIVVVQIETQNGDRRGLCTPFPDASIIAWDDDDDDDDVDVDLQSSSRVKRRAENLAKIGVIGR